MFFQKKKKNLTLLLNLTENLTASGRSVYYALLWTLQLHRKNAINSKFHSKV